MPENPKPVHSPKLKPKFIQQFWLSFFSECYSLAQVKLLQKLQKDERKIFLLESHTQALTKVLLKGIQIPLICQITTRLSHVPPGNYTFQKINKVCNF